MGTPLVLTFDIGTQSARCLLVKPDGSFQDICQLKYDEPYYSRKPGWAEQRPDFYYDRICEAGKTVCSRNEEILWLDKRQAEFNDPFPFYKKWIFKIAGVEDTTKILYRATASNWIQQNQPDLWKKTAKFVMLPTYLNYKLTSVLADSEANMVGHIPFDYKHRVWKTNRSLTKCI